MRTLHFFLLISPLFSLAQPSSTEIAKWEAHAKRVNIIQDDWGIPHIYGKTDADAVFGLMYVQCEQNFERVELNHLELMGRMSEVSGRNRLYEDLQMRLIYDLDAAKKDYLNSAAWLKKLLEAYADGINFFLHKNPQIKPLILSRFEPWYALLRTNGSISSTQTGGLTLQDMRNLYKTADGSTSFTENSIPFNDLEPTGSNGFALSPSKTKSKNAILYINPHTTFYYRTEVHMVSEEGLNTYGAVTWGTFFIFQGFNEQCGWMHTTGYADVADLFREKVQKTREGYTYLLDGKQMPVKIKQISISYKQGGRTREENFTTYSTHRGSVMGMRDGDWLSLSDYNRSLNSLMQSWLRTKARGFESFKKVMAMKGNSSDNTVFADNMGNIAYWHGNFVPRRNTKYDYTLPVDGTTSATDWKGLHSLEETVHVYNPKTGWIQNCNSTPFTVSGTSSPKKDNYPVYMAHDGQNARALNAVRLLSKASGVTLDDMISIGYNRYLSAFDFLLPGLFMAFDSLPASDELNKTLGKPIHLLRTWDKNASASSVATTLAIEWATKLAGKVPPARTQEHASNQVAHFDAMAARTSAADKLSSLVEVMKELEKNFDTWEVPWGDMNRYQRTPDGKFYDNKPSWPVGLGPGAWGSLPSYASRRFDTKKRYGVSGNSFVAAVEFGKKLKAKTILVSGESFDPASRHFSDQAEGYIEGKFKDIYFYKEDVMKHMVRKYQPGEMNR